MSWNYDPMWGGGSSYHVSDTHLPSFSCLFSCCLFSQILIDREWLFFIISSELGGFCAPKKYFLMCPSYKAMLSSWLLGEAGYPVCGDTKWGWGWKSWAKHQMIPKETKMAKACGGDWQCDVASVCDVCIDVYVLLLAFRIVQEAGRIVCCNFACRKA